MNVMLADVVPGEETKPGDLIAMLAGRPVFLLAGASEDGEDDGDEDEDGEGEEDEDDGDETVTLKKSELDAIKKHKNQAQKEAKERRLLLESLGIDPKTGKKLGDDDDEDDTGTKAKKTGGMDKAALKKAVATAMATERAKWKPVAIKAATTSAFTKEGWTGETAELAKDLLDLDELDLDDEGNVIGLDDQISELKRRFPGMFKKKKATTTTTSGAGSVDGGDKKTKSTGQKNWLEKVSAQIS